MAVESGCELRLHARRQIGGGQAFERLLAGLHVRRVIVKRHHDVGQAELRVRKHPHRVRQAVQRRFNGNRDLLLDFLRRAARIKRDDIDLNVRDIGKRLDGQVVNAATAAADEKHRHQHDEQRLVQRKTDDPFNHGNGFKNEESWRPSFHELLQQHAAVRHDLLAGLQTVQNQNAAGLFGADGNFLPGELAGLLLERRQNAFRLSENRRRRHADAGASPSGKFTFTNISALSRRRELSTVPRTLMVRVLGQ
jgi:hypothetical protein